MSRLFTLVILTTLVGCSSAPSKDNSSVQIKKPEAAVRQGWYEFPLYGDVESVTCTEYDLSGDYGNFVRHKKRSDVYYFNNVGDVIKYIAYDSDYSREYKYEYDSNGKVLQSSTYNLFGSLYEKHVYKYDSFGVKSELSQYSSDDSLSAKYIYKYDTNGKIYETYQYNSDGELCEKFIYEYDIEGNMTKQLCYNVCGSLLSMNTYMYDSVGNCTEFNEYNSDNTLKMKYTNTYDIKGNNINGTMCMYRHKYGNISYMYVKKYDLAGNVVEVTMYDGEEMIPFTQIEYTITYRE